MDAEQLRKKIIERTRKQVREKLSGREVNIVKAMNTLEDLDLIFNMLFEAVRDWYSIHFPELFKLVKEPEKSLELISNLGTRENFSSSKIVKYYGNQDIAKELEAKAKNSAGAEIDKDVAAQLEALAKLALEIKKQREALLKMLEKEMLSEMPNLTKVAGVLLAAKLLRETKSLQKLACLPSSTIQVIGAEKALFKHLRTGAKPPKHGIIFQHPLMRKVKRENRGKIARALANKISIAAKADYFGKKDISSGLIKELEERAKELSQ